MIYYRFLRKIMIRHILSIVTTLLFLLTSSYCWFNFRNVNVYEEYKPENLLVSQPIVFESLKKINDSDINNLNGYNFTVLNTGQETSNLKITIVSDILSDSVSNNYIKYSINNSEIHSLNSDGIIYSDKILESETKKINLKIWISETYSGDLNYNGRVIVS